MSADMYGSVGVCDPEIISDLPGYGQARPLRPVTERRRAVRPDVAIEPPATTAAPLRILFLTHYFPPEGNAPASRVHEMAKRWVRDGHQVTVITSAPNHPHGAVYPGFKNRLYQRQVIDGIDVVRVWTFLAANKGKIRRSLNFVSFMVTAVLAGLFCRRPNLVVATSPQFFCGWAGTIVSFFRRLPFILEIRDIWPESIAAVGAVRTKRLLKILERLEQWMYKSASHVVTVGSGYRDQLARRGVPTWKMSVVTNGVDKELFVPAQPSHEFRARYGMNGEHICAYVGTIGMAAGLGVVLRAARLLKQRGRNDIKFMLVGDGATKGELEAEAKAAGLDNVVFTGRQGKHHMPTVLATVDSCLVHLSRRELFQSVLPSKMFEAAGMGKPIILGVEGCAAEFIHKSGGGVTIEPENAEQLAAAVIRLADDEESGREFGAAGRKYVSRHFDRDKLSRQYIGVMRDVCGS
jgi:glycosyltransferase involved in cell wall biosynthesis